MLSVNKSVASNQPNENHESKSKSQLHIHEQL